VETFTAREMFFTVNFLNYHNVGSHTPIDALIVPAYTTKDGFSKQALIIDAKLP
jgi:hypothetical protein